jgi:hypothetical protein
MIRRGAYLRCAPFIAVCGFAHKPSRELSLGIVAIASSRGRDLKAWLVLSRRKLSAFCNSFCDLDCELDHCAFGAFYA